MIDLNGSTGYLTHTMAAPGTYPFTLFAWVRLSGANTAGSGQAVFAECQIAAGRRARCYVAQNSAFSEVNALAQSSWGGTPVITVSGAILRMA